jgi:hypothetical protein
VFLLSPWRLKPDEGLHMGLLFYILRNWLRGGRRLPRRERCGARGRRPVLEGLEDRNLLSLAPVAGALVPRGTGADHYLVRFQLGTQPGVQVSADNGATFTTFTPSAGWSPTTGWAVAGGEGTFTSPQAVTGSGPQSMLIAQHDFNGDGRPDLAVVFDGRLSIFLAQPDGSFRTELSYLLPPQTQVNFLAAGDFNGDGVGDVAYVTQTPGRAGAGVNVLIGQGNGDFQTQVDLATGPGVFAVSVGTSSSEDALTVADLKGGTAPDLLLTHRDPGGQGGTTSVLLGNSDGSYQPAENLSTGPGSVSLAIGDVNADGTPQVRVVSQAPAAAAAAAVPPPVVTTDPSLGLLALSPAVEGADLPVQVLLLPGNAADPHAGAAPGAADGSSAPPDTSSFTLEVRVDLAGSGQFVPLDSHSTAGQDGNVTKPVVVQAPGADAATAPDTATTEVSLVPAGDRHESTAELSAVVRTDPVEGALASPASYELVVVKGDVLLIVENGPAEAAVQGGERAAATSPAVPPTGEDDRPVITPPAVSPVQLPGLAVTDAPPDPIASAGNELPVGLAADTFPRADLLLIPEDPLGRDERKEHKGTGPNQASMPDVPSLLYDVGQLLAQAIYLTKLKPAAAAEGASVPALAQTVGDARLQVAQVIQESAEAFTQVVRSFYARFLGREPVNAEEQGWVQMLLNGQTEEQVLSAFLMAAEFGRRATGLVGTGTPDERFVQALYLLLLLRAATDDEVSAWLNGLPSLGRRGVAVALLQSAEYRKLQLRSLYREHLEREGDAAEVDAWAASPFDLLTLRGLFVSRPELFAAP